MQQIGRVTHYYGKPGVAIVELEDELKLGDRVRFSKGEKQVDQEIASMEKEYQPVEKAGAGDAVGVKVADKVRAGATVSLLEEGE